MNPPLKMNPRTALITSRQNSWFRRFQRAGALHDEEILLEGPKQIGDALRLGWKPAALATEQGSQLPAGLEPDLIFASGLFTSLAPTRTPQRVLALFPKPRFLPEALFSKGGVVVALDAVQDPGNVGTIIRLAAAFAADGVLLTEGCADPWSPKAIRASAGTALQVPLCVVPREQVIVLAQSAGFSLFSAVAGGSTHRLPSQRSVLVLGSEGTGVSEGLLTASEPVSVLTAPDVESLNVAAAAAILLSHIFEERTKELGNG